MIGLLDHRGASSYYCTTATATWFSFIFNASGVMLLANALQKAKKLGLSIRFVFLA
jgi:hypothetical protein